MRLPKEGVCMRRTQVVTFGVLVAGLGLLSLPGVSAQSEPRHRHLESWFQQRATALGSVRRLPSHAPGSGTQRAQAMFSAHSSPASSQRDARGDVLEGQRLFDEETFGGNGRTCLTCHSADTGTVSPPDARRRFLENPGDPLFAHDGSDDDDHDGFGDGLHVTRMLTDATILMRIHLHDDVELMGHPEIRDVTVTRGIPTTLNTPA